MSTLFSSETTWRSREQVGTQESPPFERIDASPYLHWQPVLDRVLAIFIMVPAVPLMLALMALVKLTSRGPAIYRQIRVGRHGKTFAMYKIRTMRVDAEAATGPVWTVNRDPRVTWVGCVLRALHLDEFPQLINVLKGEMSLIGPRPERPEFTQVLAQQLPDYLDRLATRPGITGLAQINLPPDTDLESVRRKLTLDLEYVRRASLFLDLRILSCTLFRLLGIPSEIPTLLLGLRRVVDSPARRQMPKIDPATSAMAANDQHVSSI